MSTASSSSLSATGSTTSDVVNSTSSTVTSSSFETPTYSAAPMDPFPTTHSTPPSNPNGIATSASLYLYTFLATLVLLLGVSSAIVVRSLILRRRHRRLIEEAIRNGTWIPPASSSRPRVDLSKKPKMFEAYVPKAEFGRPDYSVALKEHVDWEGMLPLSALYSSPPPPPPDIQGGSSTSTSEADGAAATNTASSPPSALSRFVPAFLRRSRPSSTPSDNNNHTNGNGNATNTNDEKIPVTQQLGKNGKVQVAVLIAMPVPPNSSSSSRPSTSSLAAAPPHVLPQHPLSSAMSQAGPSYVDDEEDLPHIEVGVAVVPVLGSDDDVATSSGGSLSEDERKRMSEGQASTSYDVQDGNIARML